MGFTNLLLQMKFRSLIHCPRAYSKWWDRDSNSPDLKVSVVYSVCHCAMLSPSFLDTNNNCYILRHKEKENSKEIHLILKTWNMFSSKSGKRLNCVSFHQRGHKIERSRNVNKWTWAKAVCTSLGSRKTILFLPVLVSLNKHQRWHVSEFWFIMIKQYCLPELLGLVEQSIWFI